VIRFSSAALGSRAADSPLRPLDELQAAAVQGSPEIREHLAMLAAQTARVELARKGTLPDVDLSLQYGQRGDGLPDMISATVSLPLPVFKGRKQDQQVTEASAQVAVLEGEHHEMVNAIRADVARLVSDIERDRTSLALSVKAILPQSRAALTSAAASYQVGKADFLTVLENQATVFNYETDYYRTLSDFASKVAELERVVGSEVLK
jgi:outer membrane protein TolC